MKYLLIIFFIAAGQTFANPSKDLCNSVDSRKPSTISQVGRVTVSPKSIVGCSGFMISKSCFVTAGHCKKHLKIVSFNLPNSTARGLIHPSAPEDQYQVAEVLDLHYGDGQGKDWAVIRLKKNKRTGQNAGEAQNYLTVNLNIPLANEEISVVGFGQRNIIPELRNTQMLAYGKIRRVHLEEGRFKQKGKIRHIVDTIPGVSGGPMISINSNQVIGIHTNGGCYTRHSNSGVSFKLNPKLMSIVKFCQENDR